MRFRSCSGRGATRTEQADYTMNEQNVSHGQDQHDHAAHDHGHHELGFWQKYVFSQDHKVIGIQYGVTALIFLFFGFTLMMFMRWSIAYPGKALPLLGSLLQGVTDGSPW